MDHKKFLSKIGRKGGLSRSEKKLSAVRKNGCAPKLKRNGKPVIRDETTIRK